MAKQAAISREKEKAAQERAAELTQMNEVLEQEIIERKRAEQIARGQTEALTRTLSTLSQEPELNKFLGYVVRSLVEQLGETSGSIWFFDAEYQAHWLFVDYDKEHILYRSRPLPQEIAHDWDEECLATLQNRQYLLHFERDFETMPSYAPYRDYIAKRGIKTILMLPLFFGNEFLGMFSVRSFQPRAYAPHEVELAQMLAHQAALALQLMRLADQAKQGAQEAAVLEERARLAGEIHDTLAQSFTGIVMQLRAANGLVEHKPEQARECMLNASDLARAGLEQARRSVSALRADADLRDLAEALRQSVGQMTAHTPLRAEVQAEGKPYPLSPATALNLLRIGQEAVTNVLRHAQAQVLTVRLVFAPRDVTLIVRDDGIGFDLDRARPEGFGLIGMRQRAERMGTFLSLSLRPEGGLEVRVSVPIGNAQEQQL